MKKTECISKSYIIRMVTVLVAVCVLGISGCKKESVDDTAKSNESTTADEMKASWFTLDDDSHNGKIVRMSGDTLYRAGWEFDVQAKTMKNVTVSMLRQNGQDSIIFQDDDIILRDFFVSHDTRVGYLYVKDEQLVFQMDKLDGDNAEVTNDAMVAVEDDSILESVLSYGIRDGVMDDDGGLWLLTNDGKLTYINGAVTSQNNSDAGGLLVVDGAVYAYAVDNCRLTLFSASDMTKTIEYEFAGANGEIRVIGGNGEDFYILQDDLIFDCTFDGQTIVENRNISYKNTGVDGSSIIMAGCDGSCYYLYTRENMSGEENLVTLKESDGTVKLCIQLACLSNDYDSELKSLINEYNRYSENYYIEVKTYDFRQNYGDFYLDLIRGQAADIFLLNDMPVDMLAKKGVLEELTQYYAASTEVSTDELEAAVLKACEINGGQYMIMSEFSVQAAFIKAEYADSDVLSMQRIHDLLMDNPAMLLSAHANEPYNIFLNDLTLEMGRYIDWDKGECSFDDESFVKLIENAAETAAGRTASESYDTVAEQLYNGEYLLSYTHVSLEDYIQMKDTILNFCSLVGYPGNFENGHYRMNPVFLFGMNHNSDYKEAVWDFFEFVYSDKVQSDIMYSFSVLKSCNQERYEKAMAGELSMQREDTVTVNSYTGERKNGGVTLDEQDISIIQHIIDNSYMDNSMYVRTVQEIIYDELMPFFAGDKSAEETAKIIQSRMSLYLGE